MRFLRHLAATWLTLGTLAAAVPAAGDSEAFRLELGLRDGLLSGVLERAPVAAVIARIAELAGAEVVAPADEAEVTTTFSAVTPAYALAQVLRGRSYVLVLAADRRSLRRITVFGERAAVTTAPVPVEADGEDETVELDLTVLAALEDVDPAVRMQLLASTRELPLDDPRREAVLSLLSGDPDPAVRATTLAAAASPAQPGSR